MCHGYAGVAFDEDDRILVRLRLVRTFLVVNGLLLPFIARQMDVHALIWIAAFWAVTFPGAMWSLALVFQRAETTIFRRGNM